MQVQEQEQKVKDINYHVQEPFNTIFDRERYRHRQNGKFKNFDRNHNSSKPCEQIR